MGQYSACALVTYRMPDRRLWLIAVNLASAITTTSAFLWFTGGSTQGQLHPSWKEVQCPPLTAASLGEAATAAGAMENGVPAAGAMENGVPAVDVQDLRLSYSKKVPVLQGINLHVK